MSSPSNFLKRALFLSFDAKSSKPDFFNKSNKHISLGVTTLASAGTLALTATPSFATAPAAGEAPQGVTDSVEKAKAMITELDGIALAALVVALTPMGAMLTLRFLNMVLSRV